MYELLFTFSAVEPEDFGLQSQHKNRLHWTCPCALGTLARNNPGALANAPNLRKYGVEV